MARPAPAVDRVIAVLDFMAAHPSEAFSLSELCRRLQLNKATAHSLLSSLTDHGWLARAPDDKSFRPGPALFAMAAAAAGSQLTAVSRVWPEMDRLAAEVGAPCVATAVVGEEIVMLAVAGELRPFGVHVAAGQRVPLVPPLGTVFLAWAGPAEVDRWLRRVDADDPDHDRYRQALGKVRDRGYSLQLEGDTRAVLERALAHEGDESLAAVIDRLGHEDYLLLDPSPDTNYRLSVVAAPVFGPSGEVTMVLSLFDLPDAVSAAEAARVGKRLVTATDAATRVLGGHRTVPEGT